MKKVLSVLAGLAASGATVVHAAPVVVDLSPDATAVPGNRYYYNSYSYPQTQGDSFTLSQGTTITGMSIYTAWQGGINGTWGVGSITDVAVFADAGGSPGAALIYEAFQAVDAYDKQGATTDSSWRSHVTLNTPVFLPAGTYYLTMPGVVDDPGAWCGVYGDNAIWSGFDGAVDLEGGSFAGFSDMYMQIEGVESVVPLPSASALAGLGLLGLGVRRRRGSL